MYIFVWDAPKMVSFYQLPAVKRQNIGASYFVKSLTVFGLNLIRSCPKCVTHLIAVHSRLVIKKKTTKCFNPANDVIPRDSSQSKYIPIRGECWFSSVITFQNNFFLTDEIMNIWLFYNILLCFKS